MEKNLYIYFLKMAETKIISNEGKIYKKPPNAFCLWSTKTQILDYSQITCYLWIIPEYYWQLFPDF